MEPFDGDNPTDDTYICFVLCKLVDHFSSLLQGLAQWSHTSYL